MSEAFEVLSDSNKRAVYDQFGEEGLKGGGGGPPPGAGGGGGGFPGFGDGTTFSFSSGGPGSGRAGGFTPADPNDIFAQFFQSMGGGGGLADMLGGMSGASRGMPSGMGGMPSGMGGMPRGMGGMGGMPGGMGGMGGMPGGMGGMPGGMPGGSRHFDDDDDMRGGAKAAPPEISRPLKVSLEDLYHGTTKHLKVGRKLLSGGTEDKVLEVRSRPPFTRATLMVLQIVVLPGWKSGTKVRFPRAGNEVAPGEAQDLVFVVEEKPHARFTRDGHDLRTKVPLPLVDALAGPVAPTRTVEALDGRKLSVRVPAGVVRPGQTTTIPGEGMPARKAADGRKKGDLIVEWDIVFPERLTPAQKEGVRKVLG
jgi:DnaJ family protein B protein 4